MGNLCLAAITIQACNPDFPPLCHQDDYFSPILPEDTFQMQSVPAETAQLGLAKSSQRFSLHWMFNSDVEYLNEPFLSLKVCKHNANSLIPSSSTSSPQHCRRSPCQQHHQLIMGKSPWDSSKSRIWRGREAPAAPRRSSLGASASRRWDVLASAWDGVRLGGAWSWVVSAHTAQWCHLSLVGGLYLGVLSKETLNRKHQGFGPFCRSLQRKGSSSIERWISSVSRPLWFLFFF